MCSNLEMGWIMDSVRALIPWSTCIIRTDLEGSPDGALLNDWKQISCIVDF